MKKTVLASLSAALLSISFAANVAYAAAPQQKTQAPGFFRMALGDFEVTALNDGTLGLDTQI
ncbi:MAG: MBL fold metallo-hydrolase, partial [Burkholderiales bacterium]|nr:MBL fold metallo-hydrolase [Burkholderiales bacterium]